MVIRSIRREVVNIVGRIRTETLIEEQYNEDYSRFRDSIAM